jgi:hypothetical protein
MMDEGSSGTLARILALVGPGEGLKISLSSDFRASRSSNGTTFRRAVLDPPLA